LVAAGEDWRFLKGLNAPESGWQTLPDASLSASWLTGPGGFGYGDGDDATELIDMLDSYTTVYIRREFTVTEVFDPELHAILSVRYDDGFVAYLDGVEVGRQFVPGTPGVEPSNTVTTFPVTHEVTEGDRVLDLGVAATVLPPGTHVLAFASARPPAGTAARISVRSSAACGKSARPWCTRTSFIASSCARP
jgi:hypothetical protein